MSKKKNVTAMLSQSSVFTGLDTMNYVMVQPQMSKTDRLVMH